MSRRAVLAAVVVTAVLAGCGGQHPSARAHRTAAGTPANSSQVLVLARVLESDFQHVGARFTATFQVNGQPVRATGRVDFRSGWGTVLVSPVGSGQGPPRQYFWTRTRVLAQAAPGSDRYQSEVPNEQGNPVHAMIGFINLLSAETIDNTANISAQSPLFLGHTTIAGAPVDEFRDGGDTTMWILTGSGLLRRIYTTKMPGGMTVDLLSHEPVKIDLPPIRH